MTRIQDIAASLRTDDGTITVATDGDATVYLDTPNTEPLDRRQTVLTLRVTGDAFEASVDFDHDDADALREALQEAE